MDIGNDDDNGRPLGRNKICENTTIQTANVEKFGVRFSRLYMPLFRARSRSSEGPAMTTSPNHVPPRPPCKSGLTQGGGSIGAHENGDDFASCKGTLTPSSRATSTDESAGRSQMCVNTSPFVPLKFQVISGSQTPNAFLYPILLLLEAPCLFSQLLLPWLIISFLRFFRKKQHKIHTEVTAV